MIWRRTSKCTIHLCYTSKYNILWRRRPYNCLTMARDIITISAYAPKSPNQRPKYHSRKCLRSLQWAFREGIRFLSSVGWNASRVAVPCSIRRLSFSRRAQVFKKKSKWNTRITKIAQDLTFFCSAHGPSGFCLKLVKCLKFLQQSVWFLNI